MNLSNREKGLLSFLLVCIVFFLSYRFLYVPKIMQIEDLDAEISDSASVKMQLEKSVNGENGTAESIKGMRLKMQEMDRLLPVKVYQEQVIVYLESLLSDHGIDASNISYSTEVLGSASLEERDEKDSLETLLYDYENGKNGKTLEELKKPGENPADGKVEEASPPEVKRFEVSINFSGTYENAKAFIDKLESDNRLICVQTVNMFSDNGAFRGNMTIGFPFYEDGSLNRLLWEMSGLYGKSGLFSDEASGASYSPDQTEFNRSDFYLFLEPAGSDLPSVTLGKTPYNYTAVYGDSEKPEVLRLALIESDSVFAYRYENSLSSFPVRKDSFEPFEADSPNIVLNVYVRQEGGLKAVPGALLKIQNDSGRLLTIHVIGDDPVNPRFKYEAVSGEIRELRLP